MKRTNATPEEARARAEARFAKAERAERDNEASRAEYRAKSQAVDDKTARLKALRLARDAADAEAKSSEPAKAPARARRRSVPKPVSDA